MMTANKPRIIANDPTKFGIEIDFKKGVGDPSRVFRAMSELIDALQGLDNGLIGTIDTKLEPILLLEDVETGSIRSWLKQSLESLEDGDLEKSEWKAIGTYLVKCKYLVIDFIGKRTEITDAQQVADLEAKILNAAEETGAKQIPVYLPPSRRHLLQGMEQIGDALMALIPEDKATYLSSQGNTEFNLAFHIAPEQIEDLITSEMIDTPTTMIMKVKKPDFLGESKWEFKYNTVIEVKMTDAQWVADYQAGKIPVNPGDAIKADVIVTVRYGLDREILSTYYTATKVLEVIRKTEMQQKPLFGK